jgi:exopolysaccharide biosynthesis polyprenyl glycosylphosphotransferase
VRHLHAEAVALSETERGLVSGRTGSGRMSGEPTGGRQRWWQRANLARGFDTAVIAGSWTLALAVFELTATSTRSVRASLLLTLVAVAVTVGLFERRGLYHERPALPRTEQTARTITSALIGTTAVALVAALADFHLGGRELALGGLLSVVGVSVLRGYVQVMRSWDPSGPTVERIAVVGTGEEARELVQLIAEHPESHFQVVGVIGDHAVAERHGLSRWWMGSTSSVLDLLGKHQIDSVVVTSTGFRGRQFREITRALLTHGFRVRVTTGITRLHQGRFEMESLVHEPLVCITPQRVSRVQLALKRVGDLVAAGVLLVLAAPVMLITGLLIKLEDRGPVLFRQKRVGAGGELFTITKFRSMVEDADSRKATLATQNERQGPLFKMSGDPRITRVGRFIRETSIDELPQLFDVLRGDMSLVGPRPALPDEIEAFDAELHGRFTVRPGITGLWQIEARSNASFDAYRRLDLHYIENWSLMLDLKILLATGNYLLVTLATIPLRLLRRSSPTVVDGITSAPPPPAAAGAEPLIDLREPLLAQTEETSRPTGTGN